MNYLRIEIPGTPHAQERGRVPEKHNKRKQPIKSQSQRNAEYFFRTIARAQMRGKKQLQGPILMVAEYVFKRPKSHFGRGGKIKVSAPVEHIQVPDKSNLDKHVEDCLNKMAYPDDRQITTCLSRKRWAKDGEESHTTVLFIESKPEFWSEMVNSLVQADNTRVTAGVSKTFKNKP